MTLRWLIASIHLLGLAIGLGAIFVRAHVLRRASAANVRTVFLADNLWGLAAIIWLVTGVWRAFFGLEKGTAYYMAHPLFWAKLTVFVLIVLLEIRPAVTLVRWRRALAKDGTLDLSPAPALARISYFQIGLVVVIVFLATGIARGLGF